MSEHQDDGEVIQTGTVGNEGWSDGSAVLGVPHAAHRVICEIPGSAFRAGDIHQVHAGPDYHARSRGPGERGLRVLLPYSRRLEATLNRAVAALRN